MDSSIFFGGSVVAAFVAGMIALAAPCCVSVMLPAYLASAFQNRRMLVAMTFVFAAGVATVVLPIAMGAAVLRRLITAQHTAIYVTAGVVMIALAAYTLLGGKLRIPTPGRRGGGTGPLSVYSLGVFSGIATSCCAPVLAGVIALAGVASSFGLALGLGAAYVFGMVAPLFVMGVLWERVDWRASRLFKPRSVTLRLGGRRRSVSAASFVSGVLLLLMGGAMVWIGLARDSMPSGSGWQARFSATLQHWGHELTSALSWVPGWAAAAVLVVSALLLARKAIRQATTSQVPEDAAHRDAAPEGTSPPAAQPARVEPHVEHDYV
jgi:cytochrome c biogenesis protein CcdA